MKNKEQRKYIREALRVVEITKQDKNYSDGRFDYIIEILKLADDVVKKLIIPIVIKSVCDCEAHAFYEWEKDENKCSQCGYPINATNLINW